MIKMPGRLSVKTIHGRNGPFNVGRLATSLGEFTVKDPQLDQFSEGVFDGEFLVQQIKPASYFAGGRLVVEVRAKVGEMLLTDDGVLVTPSSEPNFDSAEMDPLEEDAAAQSVQPVPLPAEPPVESTQTQPVASDASETTGQQAPPETDPQNPDAALFGHLWPLDNTVKLDPTIDRGLFRQQVQRLKALGYQFQGRTQTWLLRAAA